MYVIFYLLSTSLIALVLNNLVILSTSKEKHFADRVVRARITPDSHFLTSSALSRRRPLICCFTEFLWNGSLKSGRARALMADRSAVQSLKKEGARHNESWHVYSQTVE